MNRRALWLVALAMVSAAWPLAARPRDRALLAASVERLERSGFGLELAVTIYRRGEGVVYEHEPDEPRPAASAIKSFVALDLLRERPEALDRVPAGVEAMLQPGANPAFAGFSEEGLDHARSGLVGRSYRELARIMMGRTDAPNDVYNAACNVLMVKLGGPEAIHERIHRVHPDFAGVDINRYMYAWDGDGDNLATPRSLVTLYRLTAEGRLPGLDDTGQDAFRDLLHDHGMGTDSRFEKPGTLYPEPMARVRAGYEERGDRDLIYAIMGTMHNARRMPPEDAFVLLLAAVDTLTEICRELP